VTARAKELTGPATLDAVDQPQGSLAAAPPTERLGRLLASPGGVLVILPLLVISAGVVVLLLGRRATTDASDTMARQQLAAQAVDVQHDVAFALDQAQTLLVSMRAIADSSIPIEDAAIRMRDIVAGRPGVANVSVAFPSGVMRGTFIDLATGELQVQESRVGEHGTARSNYKFKPGPQVTSTEVTDYDPRVRPHYTEAIKAKTRLWMPPRTFFTSHKTGLTVTEPIYNDDGSLRAVTTVDFDVGELSSFIVRAPLESSRTVVFAADGTILAFPSAPLPEVASKENRLLRHQDFADPALESLFAAIGKTPIRELTYFQLHSDDGDYLASVAPVGGKRAGIAAPLDWYLTTLVPERTLLGPTQRLSKQSLIASGGALAIALGVALMFAWNLVRMRRAVGVAREAARSAEARAKDLGSYRLVSKLGAGGMGEVWRAEHRLLARQAAIKLVRPEALRDPNHAPKIRERFRREAQTLASMRSRHTIELYDYGVTDDGTFFYVMELLDGFDLDTLVRSYGAQSPARVIHLMAQACQSLAEAHDAGLLHRDIKPANLFVSRAADEVDVLKVLDFGIVQMRSEGADPVDNVALPQVRANGSGERVLSAQAKLTQIGSVVGTPGYIPPEQAYGEEVDGRGDLYALGCVAWWLLTSTEVFARVDDEEAIRAHAQEPVPPLRPRVRGWLPQELEDIVLSLLAKSPSDRPRDANVLAKRLREIKIDDDHAWTEARAQAWWYVNRPTKIEAPVAPPSQQVVVADAGSQVPVPLAGPSAKTIQARRSR